jgi:HD superfamily phosphodiesterase
MDVVDWACNEAQHALRSTTRRWAHTQAVAERATEIAGVVAIEDRPTLVAAAYLHDIGYGADLAATGFHPLDGAVWLRAQGRERLARLVAHHSGARFEAAARGYSQGLAAFAEERSAVADTLGLGGHFTGLGPGTCVCRVSHLGSWASGIVTS